MTILSCTVFSKTTLFTTLSSLFKLARTFFTLSISIIPMTAFKLAKPDLVAKFDVSTSVLLFKSTFAHN